MVKQGLRIWSDGERHAKMVISEGQAPTKVTAFTANSAFDKTLIKAKFEFFVLVEKPLQDFLT